MHWLVILPFIFHERSTTYFYSLSLHDALPISARAGRPAGRGCVLGGRHRVLRTATAREGARRLLLRLRGRSEEHTSELQSQSNLVCRLLLEKKTIQTTDVSGFNGPPRPNFRSL